MKPKFLVAMLALVATACASTPPDAEPLAVRLSDMGYEMLGPVERVNEYRIDGWQYVDDYHTIFEAGRSEYYLLSFNQRCTGLRSAFTIGFTDRVGRLSRFDSVLVRDRAGGMVERCTINVIHRLKKVPS